MRNQKKLILDQLDRKLAPFSGSEGIQVPASGWIRTIRLGLNMTLEQLGSKLGKTRQGVKKMEESESAGSISVKSLKEVASALDATLVYAFIPNNGSFTKLVEQKSYELAEKIVLRTSHNMQLEDQGNNREYVREAIEELSLEIKRELRRSIWD